MMYEILSVTVGVTKSHNGQNKKSTTDGVM